MAQILVLDVPSLAVLAGRVHCCAGASCHTMSIARSRPGITILDGDLRLAQAAARSHHRADRGRRTELGTPDEPPVPAVVPRPPGGAWRDLQHADCVAPGGGSRPRCSG